MTTPAQNKAIHALLKSMPDFTDEDYRALLQREFRRKSSTGLTFRQAAKLIEMLKALGGKHEKVRRASEMAEGPYAGKLRALWIGLYNLGLVHNADDKAMLTFVKRQTKVEHTRFLVEPADAAKAIEALKQWAARDGGVEWPARGVDDPDASKRAVCKAVAKKCFDATAFTPFQKEAPFEGRREWINDYGDECHVEGCWPMDFEAYGYKLGCPAGFADYTGEDWDNLARLLGARLRARRAKAAKTTKKEAA